jgi:hypothetical protein
MLLGQVIRLVALAENEPPEWLLVRHKNHALDRRNLPARVVPRGECCVHSVCH